jgi:signal transduction histidine kinase
MNSQMTQLGPQSPPFGRVGQWIADQWQALTRPHPSITNSDLQRRARLAAGLCGSLLFTSLFLLIVRFDVLNALGIIGFAVSYGMSRWRVPQVSGLLVIISNLALSANGFLRVTNWAETSILAYVIWWALPLLVTVLILPPRFTLLAVLLHVPIFGVIFTLFPQARDIPAAIGSGISFGALLVASAFLQEYYLVRPQVAEAERAQKLLERRNQALERANRELREFSYVLAHDLRSPLLGIQGVVREMHYDLDTLEEAIKLGLAQLPTDEAEIARTVHDDTLPESLKMLDQSAERLKVMVNEVMALARVGQREFKLESVGLRSLMEGVVQRYAPTIQQQAATVTLSSLPIITTDRLAVEQIFTNLLDNALKYLRPDGPKQIHITYQRQAKEIVVQVQDSGRGIPEYDHAKVLQPFRRASNTDDVRGDGVGLAYVQSLVQRLGGRLWFQSQEGVGTTFFVSLPLDPQIELVNVNVNVTETPPNTGTTTS